MRPPSSPSPLRIPRPSRCNRQNAIPSINNPAGYTRNFVEQFLVGVAIVFERWQHKVSPSLLAQLNIVTLPQHPAEVHGPLMSHVKQRHSVGLNPCAWSCSTFICPTRTG